MKTENNKVDPSKITLAHYTVVDDLVEALADAEFLLRKCAINPKEAGAMRESMFRSAADARQAIAKAKGEA